MYTGDYKVTYLQQHGDSLVEGFNQSLLHILSTYIAMLKPKKIHHQSWFLPQSSPLNRISINVRKISSARFFDQLYYFYAGLNQHHIAEMHNSIKSNHVESASR